MREISIDDCFIEIRNGANIKQGVIDGGYPITRIETLSNDKFNRERMGYAGISDLEKYEGFILEDEDLLMSHINSVQYLGRTVLYKKLDDEVIIHGMNLLKLKPNKDIVYPAYIKYLFYGRKFRNNISKITKKSVNQASFAVGDLKKIIIELPGIKEQASFVDKLDRLEKVIKLRTEQLVELDNLNKSRFVEMFGDPLTNPMGWEEVVITELCEKICGGGTPSKSHPEYFEGHIPWVSPKDMKSMVIRDSQDHITEEAIENSSTNIIPENSVLMVIRSGILKHTLPVAINAVPVTINQDMKAFVPGKKIHSAFLMNYFKAVEPNVLSGVRGVTADNIDFKDFQKRMVILPPIDLQKQYATFVKQVDKLKVEVLKSLDETQWLFDSLMQKYFD